MVSSHPKDVSFIPWGNCITYWSVLPASNRHRGWNCWWQLGNSYENNKESLRHKTQVSHLRTFHLPSHAPLNADNSHRYQGSGFTDSDEHLSPLQPLPWQINRGDRQSFYITSMTIALYIFYQRNRLLGPSRNPHIHFLLPHTHPLPHRWSIYRRGISTTAVTFMALSPRQKQRDPKQGLESNPNLSRHQCCHTHKKIKNKNWTQTLPQHQTAPFLFSVSGMSTERAADTRQPSVAWFSSQTNEFRWVFHYCARAKLKARAERGEYVIIIRVEGSGRSSFTVVLVCLRSHGLWKRRASQLHKR